MRILLFGSFGQLGWELRRTLASLGEVTAIDYPEINLADEEQTRQVIRISGPHLIINAAAYTAVDQAEGEPALARAINTRAPGIMAEEAQKIGAALVHYSTDYVFDGSKGSTYIEEDSPNPLGEYGRSKLDGERSIQQVGGAYLILRTAWVYSLRRNSFVTKVLQWSRQQPVLRVVDDQVSNPTWARMLAEITALLLGMGKGDFPSWLGERAGLYHLAGEGFASRFEWARAILEGDPRKDEQVTREIQPASTSEFPTPAQRPLFSALNCERFTRAFGLRLPSWQDSLKLAMEAC